MAKLTVTGTSIDHGADWAEFKKWLNGTYASFSYTWAEETGSYTVIAYDGSLVRIVGINKDGGADCLDFEAHYKGSTTLTPSDIDGAIMIRPKAAKKGWVYALLDIEFVTAKLGSLYSKTKDGTDRAGVSMKLYDADGAEVTSSEGEAGVVRTVVCFEPPYDYEVIGGQLQQAEKPTTDVRVWVTAVPDVPANYGGSKEMIGGANLKFVDPADKIMADGRVSKLMPYSATYHTNKLEFTLKHDAGVQHNAMILVELFRA